MKCIRQTIENLSRKQGKATTNNWLVAFALHLQFNKKWNKEGKRRQRKGWSSFFQYYVLFVDENTRFFVCSIKFSRGFVVVVAILVGRHRMQGKSGKQRSLVAFIAVKIVPGGYVRTTAMLKLHCTLTTDGSQPLLTWHSYHHERSNGMRDARSWWGAVIKKMHGPAKVRGEQHFQGDEIKIICKILGEQSLWWITNQKR